MMIGASVFISTVQNRNFGVNYCWLDFILRSTVDTETNVLESLKTEEQLIKRNVEILGSTSSQKLFV